MKPASKPAALLDTSGLECPQPALLTRQRLAALGRGQLLRIIATDPLAVVDLKLVCERGGHHWAGSRIRADGRLEIDIRRV